MHSPEAPPRTDRITPRYRMVVKDITDQTQLHGALAIVIALNLLLLGMDVIGNLRIGL